MQSSDDFELLSRISTGDESAFETCFNKYWQLLYAFASRILRSEEDAKDVVQVVYISLWGRRHDLNIQGSLEHYLLQAVRFQSLKKLKELLDRPEELDRVHDHIIPVLNDIWEKLDTSDLYREINQQLNELPPKTKEIFLLSRQQQLTIAEIAARMNLSEKTVRNQLHIALKALRQPIAYLIIFADVISQ